MRIRSLIIEDEPLARQTLRDFALEFDDLEIIGEAVDGVAAVRLIDETKPELIFLDVQIPEISGLEVLCRTTHQPAVVFTTAFDNYAIKAFELEALDYLQKPFGRERFRQTIQRVLRRLNDKNVVLQKDEIDPKASKTVSAQMADENALLERIFVRVGQRIIPVQVSDIVRLVAEDDYTRVHVAGHSYLVDTTLGEFENKLPPLRFCRVHRSTIVNLDRVRLLEPFDRRLMLQLSDGSKVIASRAGSQVLRNLIV